MNIEKIGFVPGIKRGPGVERFHLTFGHPLLAAYEWPCCEITGRLPGPRLCISAGVHVNEVSSIEAAVRLQSQFDPNNMSGSVSIIPLTNQPARHTYSEYICPLDEKNINFRFPGDVNGSFSDVLCHAITAEWTAGSDCYIDMHGGDLREKVAKFTYYQQTGVPDFDHRAEYLASCFDADLIVGLPMDLMNSTGRPPTGHAKDGRIALMSEAGANGVIDEASVDFHVQGVLNVATALGIIQVEERPFRRKRSRCVGFENVIASQTGEFHAFCDTSDEVVIGQILGEIRDLFGNTLAKVISPANGHVLWLMSHPTIVEGDTLLSVAIREELYRYSTRPLFKRDTPQT